MMAAVTNRTPPPTGLSSPPRSKQRTAIPAPDLSPQRYQWIDTTEDSVSKPLPTLSKAESPKLRGAPVSPVRLNFHPDNWAQPSNATIEGNQPLQRVSASVGGYSDRDLPKTPNAPLPPPHAPTPQPATRSSPPKQRRPSIQESLGKPLPPTFALDLPHRSKEENPISPAILPLSSSMRDKRGIATPDSGSISEKSQKEPNRHSRESDTTASTQQQASTKSSAETNASSLSQDASESQEESIIQGGIPGNQSVPQLQYHHQPVLPRVASAPLAADSRHSSAMDLTDQGLAINRHLTPNSVYGRRSSIPRPASAYSVYSDFGAQGRSPGYSRTGSSQARRSPETRPISYAELLNVPYPQPAPAPINIDNSSLRNNIGSNASLLSTQKTLEMYRQNVKKTNDFSIQYSFAVFLISTAQEQGLSYDEPTKRKVSKIGGTSDGVAAESSSAELVREARSILTRLANGGYPFAQYYLADGFASGLFNKGKEDYSAAFPLFVLAAKHGHAESAYRAGLCYEFGWGCRKDPAKAVQYLRTAASRSHPGAMTRLGKACLSGDLGENRYREAIKWLKRATESSDTMYNGAPYQLGVLYETGYGDDIFKDESYAAELFTQAAELGHPEANYRMGDAYEHGKLSCPRDPALSVHFYTGAAERGHPAAMMGLCAWYMVGADPILEKDEEEAYEWARRSAELGFVKAEYAVGYFTEMGIGCRRDVLEANVWYVKAADSGDERAKQRLAAIRAAVSGGTPMEVAPPRNAKMKKTQPKDAKDDKDCVIM
ncbi:HCP-like protein [Xylariales sp. AK1849]|nr:HCP-like protein [Xylariales sp. AK1849]